MANGPTGQEKLQDLLRKALEARRGGASTEELSRRISRASGGQIKSIQGIFGALGALGEVERGAAEEVAAEVGAGAGLVSKVAQGATFGFFDELVGAVGGERAKELVRESEQLAGERAGGASLALELGGGLLIPGLAGARAARAGAAAGRGSGLGNLARVGAAEGALFGAGTAEEGGRLRGAATGAATGLIAAPVVGGAGAAAVGAGRRIGQRVVPSLRRAADERLASGVLQGAVDLSGTARSAEEIAQAATEQAGRLGETVLGAQPEFQAIARQLQRAAPAVRRDVEQFANRQGSKIRKQVQKTFIDARGKTPGSPSETKAVAEASIEAVRTRRAIEEQIANLDLPSDVNLITPGQLRTRTGLQAQLDALPQFPPQIQQTMEALELAGEASIERASKLGRKVLARGANAPSAGEISRFVEGKPAIVRDVMRTDALDEITRQLDAGADPLKLFGDVDDATLNRLRVTLGDDVANTLNRAAREGQAQVDQLIALAPRGTLDDAAARQLLAETGQGAVGKAVDAVQTAGAFGVQKAFFRTGLQQLGQFFGRGGERRAARVRDILSDVLTSPTGAQQGIGLLQQGPGLGGLATGAQEAFGRLAAPAGGLLQGR